MSTYHRPSFVSLGGTTITTVTSVTVNESFSSGSFAGDDNAYAAGWVGVGQVAGSITLGDVSQALALIGTRGTLIVHHKGTAGAATLKTEVPTMQITARGMSQPFDANSGITLSLVYVGAARSSGNNPVSHGPAA